MGVGAHPKVVGGRAGTRPLGARSGPAGGGPGRHPRVLGHGYVPVPV
jgi:hypothetical protein